MKILMCVAIAALLFSSATLAAAGQNKLGVCPEYTKVERVNGQFQIAQSGNCCITCSGQTACTTCTTIEVCDRQCRAGGTNPGVSCRPR
jgi:hypothetical protein